MDVDGKYGLEYSSPMLRMMNYQWSPYDDPPLASEFQRKKFEEEIAAVNFQLYMVLLFLAMAFFAFFIFVLD